MLLKYKLFVCWRDVTYLGPRMFPLTLYYDGTVVQWCCFKCQNINFTYMHYLCEYVCKIKKLNPITWVRERTTPTERSPLVGEISANFLQLEGAAWSAWRTPYGRILGFIDRSSSFFFQLAPQLYSRGWVGPVPDPLLFTEFGGAGNRRNLLHRERHWISSSFLS
jgi:hypothetical protein